MPDVQVTCIIKPNPQNLHEHITHLGNYPKWMWTREEVVSSIDAKTNTFYVLDPFSRKRAEVGVVRESGKAPYLRTYADGNWNNNLLSLPHCLR